MQKRQMLLGIVAVIVLVAGGGAWWFLQQSAPVEEEMVVAKPKAPVPAPAPTPAPAATPAAPSDAVALSEEELDKIKAEAGELAARAADLEEQVRDGQMIIDMKAKQIAKIQEELKQLESTKPARK